MLLEVLTDGGVGTLIGPIVGVVALQYLSLKLGETAFINNLVILGIVLVLLVLLMPRGIVPTMHEWLRKALALVRQPSRGGAP